MNNMQWTPTSLHVHVYKIILSILCSLAEAQHNGEPKARRYAHEQASSQISI